MRRRDYQNSLYSATGADVPAEARSPAWDWLQGRAETAQATPPAQSGQLADYVQRQRIQARPVNRSRAAPNLTPTAAAVPAAAPVPTAGVVRDANGMIIGNAPAPTAVAPVPVAPVPVATTPVAPVPVATQPVATAVPAPVAPAQPAAPAPNQWGIDFSRPFTAQTRPAGWNDTMERLNNPAMAGNSEAAWAADPRSNPNNTMSVFYDPAAKNGDVTGYYNDFDNPTLRVNPNGQKVTLGQAGIAPGSAGDPAWNTMPTPPPAPAAKPYTAAPAPDADQALNNYIDRGASPTGEYPKTPPAVKPPPVVDTYTTPDRAPSTVDIGTPPIEQPQPTSKFVADQFHRNPYLTKLRNAVGV